MACSYSNVDLNYHFICELRSTRALSIDASTAMAVQGNCVMDESDLRVMRIDRSSSRKSATSSTGEIEFEFTWNVKRTLVRAMESKSEGSRQRWNANFLFREPE